MKKQIFLALTIAGCLILIQSCAFRPCTDITANFSGVHSRITGDADSWSGAWGFQAGAEALIPCNRDFPVSGWGGFNISMQGAGWEDDWGEGLETGVTRLWYLNLPLTARYPFGGGFYGEAGLQPGFLLSAKDKWDGEAVDWGEYIKTFDLGIPLGLGYDFPNNFGVGLRVIPGVLNINAGERADSYTNRNLTVALRGTYTFKGKDR